MKKIDRKWLYSIGVREHDEYVLEEIVRILMDIVEWINEHDKRKGA